MSILSLSYTIEVEYLDEDDNSDFVEYDNFEDARYEIEYNKEDGLRANSVSVLPLFKIEGLTLDDVISDCVDFENTLKKHGFFK